MTRQRARIAVTAAAALALTLTACASSPGAGPASDGVDAPGLPSAIAAPGQVTAQGTVLQKDGEDAQLCLGAIAESYPPQCSGAPIAGWDWAAVEGEESASGVTWGAYAVTGEWDGTTFTVDEAIMLALYDPMPVEEPLLHPDNAGDTPEDELIAIQEELAAETPFAHHASWPQNGYLFVEVDYDDGSYQAWVDAQYGPDKVAIRSLMRDA